MITTTMIAADQRTEAWKLARLGRLTGSCAGDLLAKVKTGEAAARRNLRTRLVLERLTGVSQESDFVSRDMLYGIEREPDARALYEAERGALVRQVGFLAVDGLAAGCSPDGLIVDGTPDGGLLELKCCKSATHLEYLRTKRIPANYLAQVTHNLWVTGAAWCDWVSFDDRFPEPLRLAIRRVTRESVDLAAYELVVRLFLSEVDAECEDVARLAAEPALVA